MIKIENNKLNFNGQTCEIGHVFECNHEYNGKAALFAMFDFEAEITRINKKRNTINHEPYSLKIIFIYMKFKTNF